jgi:hypothetical protein
VLRGRAASPDVPANHPSVSPAIPDNARITEIGTLTSRPWMQRLRTGPFSPL